MKKNKVTGEKKPQFRVSLLAENRKILNSSGQKFEDHQTAIDNITQALLAHGGEKVIVVDKTTNTPEVFWLYKDDSRQWVVEEVSGV